MSPFFQARISAASEGMAETIGYVEPFVANSYSEENRVEVVGRKDWEVYEEHESDDNGEDDGCGCEYASDKCEEYKE